MDLSWFPATAARYRPGNSETKQPKRGEGDHRAKISALWGKQRGNVVHIHNRSMIGVSAAKMTMSLYIAE
jgi:hypothetical protein